MIFSDGSNDFWWVKREYFMPLVPMFSLQGWQLAFVGCAKCEQCKLSSCFLCGLHLPLVIKNGPRHRHYMWACERGNGTVITPGREVGDSLAHWVVLWYYFILRKKMWNILQILQRCVDEMGRWAMILRWADRLCFFRWAGGPCFEMSRWAAFLK